MADILKRNKALSVNPLKASQPIGGSLATLGFNRAMPMLHGSQGCTAFAKVFFVRHFREPIPLQSTAMDQGSSVMGADENVREGIKTIAEKSHPALINVLSVFISAVVLPVPPALKVVPLVLISQNEPVITPSVFWPIRPPPFEALVE